MHNALNKPKSTLKCIKSARKQYNHSIQTSNVHLYTSKALISKTLSLQAPTNAPKHAPMHLQHEAPQRLLQMQMQMKI